MDGFEAPRDPLAFIVAALSAGWSFHDVDRRVAAQFPDLQGPELTQVYRQARDRLVRQGWRYPHRRRAGAIPWEA